MKTSSRVAWNAITRWLARGATAVAGLVLVPFLIYHLGKAGYGLLSVVSSIVGFSLLTDFGLRNAMERHLAEQVATNNRQRFNELVSTGVLIFFILGGLFGVACAVLAPLLAGVFRVPEEMYAEGVFLIRWFASITAVIYFVQPAFAAVLTSNNRFDLVNYFIAGTEIFRLGGLLLVIGLTGTGLYGWAAVCLVVEVLGLAARIYAAFRVWPALRIGLGYVKRSAYRSLASLGGYLYISQVANTLSARANPIILTVFLGPAAVAFYAPAWSLVRLVWPLVNALGPQLHPLATGYHVTGKSERLRSLLLRGTNYTFLLGVPACVVLGIFAEPITRVWLGRSLGPGYMTVARVLQVLVISELFTYAVGSQRAVLLGMNRMRFFTIVQVIGAVLNMLASIMLVGFTSLRVLGVVVPTAFEAALRRPIIAVYTARVCGLSMRRYLRRSYLGPVIVLVVLSAGAVGLMLVRPPTTLVPLLAAAAGVGFCWLPLCWWIGLNHEDRESFRQLFARARDRLLHRAPSEVVPVAAAVSEQSVPAEATAPDDSAEPPEFGAAPP